MLLWMDGWMDTAAICQTTRDRGSGGEERGDGGSDLAVASGAADSQPASQSVSSAAADIVAGDLTPGRSISPPAPALARSMDGGIKPGN